MSERSPRGTRVLASMTGFGRADVAGESVAVTAEVRCLNSRHLDVRVRLPRELAALEADARAAAAGLFLRGQVEVAVRLARQGELAPRPEIDVEAARRYAEAAVELGGSLGLEGAIPIASLLALPGVSRLREPEIDAAAIGACVLEAVERACSEAAAMRAREGEALERELRQRLERVEQRIAGIEARAGEAHELARERLEKRLAALGPEIELDPGRLEQEVLLQVDRMDVTEELVRFRSHCEQFRETLDGDRPAGRKLEFLLQELGRETNTIGAKAGDAAVARSAIEIKSELEKLREQVLNVE